MFPLAAVDSSRVTPGLLGFTVVVLLGLATWGLLRSLNTHLKRVNFEERPAAPRPPRTRSGATGEEDPPAGSTEPDVGPGPGPGPRPPAR